LVRPARLEQATFGFGERNTRYVVNRGETR